MSEQAAGKIRTLIIDDEPLARAGLRALLERDPEVEIVGECADGGEAVRSIRKKRPALLFLDVQMPEMDGMEVLEKIGGEVPQAVVFVTAHDRYALQAFEANAVDYLLKPFDDERFQKALDRAKRQVRRERAGDLSRRLIAMLESYKPGAAAEAAAEAGTDGEAYLQRLVIRSSGRVVFVKAEEIDWIGAADYYVELHVGGKSHLLREPMARLETRLDPRKFLRIHRSTIVNVERVKEIRSAASGDCTVILHDGTKLRLSRGRRDKLHLMMGSR